MQNQKTQNPIENNSLSEINLQNEGHNSNAYAEKRLQEALDLNISVPVVNAYETDDSYEMDVQLPGANKNDIKVDVTNGVLTVHSEIHQKNSQFNHGDFTQSRSFSRFKRSVALPSNADETHVQASYQNGILKVSVPKIKKEVPKLSKSVNVQ